MRRISPLNNPGSSDLYWTVKYYTCPGSIVKDVGLITKYGWWLWVNDTSPLVFP